MTETSVAVGAVLDRLLGMEGGRVASRELCK